MKKRRRRIPVAFALQGILTVLVLVAAVVPAGRAENLRRLPVEEFDRRSEVAARIDPQAIDCGLLAAAVFQETNRVRSRLGLPRFQELERLDRAADLQAEMGSLLLEVSHWNPRSDEATALDRVVKAGLVPGVVAENLAVTPLFESDGDSFQVVRLGGAFRAVDPRTREDLPNRTYAGFARAVVEQWMRSPAHRRNILDRRLRHLGCSVRPRKLISGLDALYSVQVFFTGTHGGR